ncbi:Crp/Fnr family transcriptional regulator [Sphingomonas sp. CFBP 8760]|uniref:Crp/Fnr family transcriptional regulator n=1 Tax=Sphingomonas sp. CFBP 8760 TaxID=2775282 RepID=UPI00177D4C62|nr:Crp/Fnr family transcriptional regulator [Sphingomonas sp. CFBP 8760]MBD8548314.1 Crp/Fnr family transcriptional regulator [Sphingomonas sp. CFBP 8760]
MVNKLAQRSTLSAAEAQALLDLPHRLIKADPGNYLVRNGDRTDSCIVLLSGFVYRSKIAGNGARQIVSIHLSGDLVGLQNSFLDVADHNVQALNHVEVALIPHQAIFDVTEAFPAIAQALWRDTAVDGSMFREWLLNVGRRDARQRVAHLLCELALRQEAAGLSESPSYILPMTQEQIGDATGLTAVHVNRTVQRMRSEGLINAGKGSVTITDWERLQRVGDFCRAYLHLPATAA